MKKIHVTIRVTAKDLATAKAYNMPMIGSLAHPHGNCPIALALHRWTERRGVPGRCSVGAAGTTNSIWAGRLPNERAAFVGSLSPKASAFVRAFDNREPVGPTRLDLRLEDCR